jgi:hypothetical protein
VTGRHFSLVAIAAAMLMSVGCGGTGASSSADRVVNSYLTALADGDGETACNALTIDVRSEIGVDCVTQVERFTDFLANDADRLKGANVSDPESQDDSSATVMVSLDGQSVDVELVRVDEEWRIATGRVANRLLGIGESP